MFNSCPPKQMVIDSQISASDALHYIVFYIYFMKKGYIPQFSNLYLTFFKIFLFPHCWIFLSPLAAAQTWNICWLRIFEYLTSWIFYLFLEILIFSNVLSLWISNLLDVLSLGQLDHLIFMNILEYLIFLNILYLGIFCLFEYLLSASSIYGIFLNIFSVPTPYLEYFRIFSLCQLHIWNIFKYFRFASSIFGIFSGIPLSPRSSSMPLQQSSWAFNGKHTELSSSSKCFQWFCNIFLWRNVH